MALPNPDQARSWLGTVLPLLDRSTPITLLLALVIGGLMGWYLLGELHRIHGLNRELFDKLEAAHEARLALALQCGPRHE